MIHIFYKTRGHPRRLAKLGQQEGRWDSQGVRVAEDRLAHGVQGKPPLVQVAAQVVEALLGLLVRLQGSCGEGFGVASHKTNGRHSECGAITDTMKAAIRAYVNAHFFKHGRRNRNKSKHIATLF